MIALLAAAALAGDTRLGVGLSGGFDLPGPAADAGDFGFAPGLWIPVTVPLGEWAGLRVTVRADLGTGTDRVSWQETVGGEPVRLSDSSGFAMVVAAAATVGPEITFPVKGAVKPYLGAELGPGVAGTWHSLGGTTAHLMDPVENDLSDPGNIDPYTLQPVLATDVHFGVRGGESLGWWVEAGLGSAWLGAAALAKSTAGLDAQRDGFTWDPARIGAGVSFPL